ncbi:peptidylprolyl isomerase [Leptolyngbya sp. FACHB-671]|uniref:peptidylprolyl isomerase n=1 Tax=Leptolyngbya sp. FACHB-671 TaxID=2692812 RepID=UPI001686168E|nr:peptidylprolyl isomerase [Leptolyngbya sp. FACHB-671]MBD2070686.1 peptidylprolyl isomerase [Leptolyngbya sp. FACHB-671]
MSIVVNPISDLVIRNAQNTAVNLLNNFDDPFTTGLVARFELFNTSLGGGVTNVVLFDQPGAGAPLTVRNFQNYVSRGSYRNSIIHRSVPGFIVQGGGFTVDGLDKVLEQTPRSGADAVEVIPADAPVRNEFSAGRSNLRGTIAMAKVGNNPNSATNQWFFNLANNSRNLDNQNGGFTVFGQVRGRGDLNVIDAIARLPIFGAANFFGQSAFTDLPLSVADPRNPVLSGDENLVRYRSITVSRVNELQFRVVNNSNPNLVNATVRNNQLQLNYRPTRTGIAAITIRATNLLGDTIQDTFSVTVASRRATARADYLVGTNRNDAIRGLAGNDQILGLNGNDRLLGQAGADRLVGGAGNDFLQGGVGNDAINGGAGNDRIAGNAGRDRITTGGGRDTLIIGRGEGLDVVTDFADRLDKIQLSGGVSFGQLTIRQQQSDTLIQVGRTNLLTLENVNANLVTQADFVA